MLIGQTIVNCPNCSAEVTADEHECSCVFGNCPECNTDFEFDSNCTNN